MSEAQRALPNALTHRVDQRLHLADMAFAHLPEQSPECALIGDALPTRDLAQHRIGPQRHTLAETACSADQAHHDQEGSSPS